MIGPQTAERLDCISTHTLNVFFGYMNVTKRNLTKLCYCVRQQAVFKKGRVRV